EEWSEGPIHHRFAYTHRLANSFASCRSCRWCPLEPDCPSPLRRCRGHLQELETSCISFATLSRTKRYTDTIRALPDWLILASEGILVNEIVPTIPIFINSQDLGGRGAFSRQRSSSKFAGNRTIRLT